MKAEQLLDILDGFFNTIEKVGYIPLHEKGVILNLIFIKDYYEYKRSLSYNNPDNDCIGLTDCMVKKINNKIECLKNASCVLKKKKLDYFPGKLHWIVPDISPDDDHNHIENSTLFLPNSTFDGSTLLTDCIISNSTLVI